jgi:type IV secretion system protein VirB1
MSVPVLSALAAACAPAVHASTTQALVAVESGFNAHAIGVVGGTLVRQPRNRAEAVATATMLQAKGWNFSVGLAQINVHNFERLGITAASALDPCQNLRAMQTVLGECFDRAASRSAQAALRSALSCYYSGNFHTGFEHGYVRRVVDAVRRAGATSGVPP